MVCRRFLDFLKTDRLFLMRLYLAQAGSLIAGLLIVIGLFTSPAAFIASGEMAVAYFMFHFPESFWPTINHGEIVIANCFVFLYIAAQGGGMCSLDSARRRKES
jgi:putative oxidoreductase